MMKSCLAVLVFTAVSIITADLVFSRAASALPPDTMQVADILDYLDPPAELRDRGARAKAGSRSERGAAKAAPPSPGQRKKHDAAGAGEEKKRSARVTMG